MIQSFDAAGVESKPVYHSRNTYGYDRTEGRKMLAADWSVPLHRTSKRIYSLRKERPDLDGLILEIWRDLEGAIQSTRILVAKLGIDTSSPLRRKPGATQPQPVQPDLPAVDVSAEVLAGTPANPIRANIARALNRLAAAISPAAPVAPHNTPKGPTE